MGTTGKGIERASQKCPPWPERTNGRRVMAKNRAAAGASTVFSRVDARRRQLGFQAKLHRQLGLLPRWRMWLVGGRTWQNGKLQWTLMEAEREMREIYDMIYGGYVVWCGRIRNWANSVYNWWLLSFFFVFFLNGNLQFYPSLNPLKFPFYPF